MSLTSHLDNLDSPVRRFFHQRFPSVEEPLREARDAIRDADTIKPDSRVPYATLGTALDYRIRYYFAVTPTDQFVATKGAGQLAASPHLVEAYHDLFTPSLDGLLAEIQPARRKLESDEEDRLLRHCVVLALFEQFYRSSAALQHSPLTKLESTGLADLLGVVQMNWVDDLRALSWRFYDGYNKLLSRPATLNPTFDGSVDVGGADADIILDGRLIDIKSTISPNLRMDKFRHWFYQLLGYVLLDYGDRHEITGIGFYFARQGVLMGWAFPDVLNTLVSGKVTTLAELRSQFKRVIKRKV